MSLFNISLIFFSLFYFFVIDLNDFCVCFWDSFVEGYFKIVNEFIGYYMFGVLVFGVFWGWGFGLILFLYVIID